MSERKFSRWADLPALVGLFLAATLVAVVCAAVVGAAVPEMEREALLFVTYAVQFSLAVAGGAIYFRRRGERRLFRLGFRWFDAPLVLAGIVIVAATGVVIEPVLNLFPERYFEELTEMIGSGGWSILLTVVAAPVLEELFFRGLILEQLSRRWSATAAVLTSALLFGVVHLPNLPQMVNAFVVAVVMGYVYLAGRSLVPVILIHAINNGIAYLTMELTGTQSSDMRELIGNDTIYWLIYAVSAAVVIGAVAAIDGGLRAKGDGVRDEEENGRTKTDKITLHEKTADEESAK
ncbi:MAG: CPBP family intramembrane metalloprotease [Alistipes sp.]|jgi:membrane protease YdiL (CAAX protease family)|nr:CPBP family intramembrane metalloprotease [Alistipes sp.]